MRLLCLAALCLAACASPLPVVLSGKAPNPMAIDGDAREWEGSLRPVPEEAGLSLGLRNDADALYLVVVAGDDWQGRRIAASGLTIWLNPAGTKDKAYGVSFPVGLGSDGKRGGARPGTRPGADTPDPPDDREAMRQRLRDGFLRTLDRIEITREGERESVAVGSADGIQTAATWTKAGLTVEMRLPLREGPYAVGVEPGVPIGLGVELAQVRQRRGPRQIGGTPGGAQGGFDRPGGQRGDRDGIRRPAERSDLGTVERWMAVELAE